MKRLGLVVAAVAIVGCREPVAPEASEPPKPEAARASRAAAHGLADDEGVELVIGTCTGCHSAKLITQNRGDEAHWLRLIRWMQRTQKLWPLPSEVETQVVAYLERNYGPRTVGRRAPLPDHLMPPEDG